MAQAFFNSVSLVILLWVVLIMTSLTHLIFAIQPHFEDKEK